MLLAAFATREHCWLMLNLLSARISRSFFAQLLSSWLAPACSGAGGCSSWGPELHTSLCWTPWSCCQPISPACWGPSEQQHTHLVYHQPLRILYHMQTCWGCTRSRHTAHYKEVKQYGLNSIYPVLTLGVHDSGLASNWTLCHWSQPSEPGRSISFQLLQFSLT